MNRPTGRPRRTRQHLAARLAAGLDHRVDRVDPKTGREAGRDRDAGMVSAYLLAMMIGLFAVAGMALDPGEALAAKIRAIGQAQEAARAGAQAINLTTYRTTGALQLDPTQAISDAQAFLATEHATGTVTVTGDQVTVTITTDYKTQLWQLIGVDTIALHATGTATPERAG